MKSEELPTPWSWTEDGLLVEGTYLDCYWARTGESGVAWYPILHLAVDGVPRRIFCRPKYLRQQITGKLGVSQWGGKHPEETELEPGTEVRIEGERRVSKNGHEYVGWKVRLAARSYSSA